MIVPKDIKSTEAFVFKEIPKDREREYEAAVGNGFFIGVPPDEAELQLVYFVTAKRNVTGLKSVFLRLN